MAPTRHPALSLGSFVWGSGGAFLICSGVAVSGPIPGLCLALALETDRIIYVDEGKGVGKDDIRVIFENLDSFMGSPCDDLRIYLGRAGSSEKPAPFWHVKQTDAFEEANMETTDVAVTVHVSAEMHGRFKAEGAGALIQSYVAPNVDVKVILPVYVNNRDIEIGEKLCFYKDAEEQDKKRPRPPEAIDSLDVWKKQRAGTEMHRIELKPKGHPRK